MSKNIKSNIETGLRIIPVSSVANSSLGDLEVSSILNKLLFHNGTTSSAIVTEGHSATLVSKTIVVSSNTLTTAASGTLTQTELNAALAQLEGFTSTNATNISTLTTNFNNHTSSSTVHGVSGNVVGTTDTQNLSNKTFTNQITLQQITTPVGNPSSGYNYLYFKNDNLLYSKDSSGNESSFNGKLIPSGTRSSPNNITISGITAPSVVRSTIYVQGDSGSPVTVTANPQITAGTFTEQEIILVGRSDTATVTLTHGNGLSLNGNITLEENSTIYLRYDGVEWVEVSRS